MPSKHTRREWWADGPFIYGWAKGSHVTVRLADTNVADDDKEFISNAELDANVERIVGCVNGCQGIKDPARTVPELVEIVRDLYQRTNSGFLGGSLNLRELKRVLDRCDVL